MDILLTKKTPQIPKGSGDSSVNMPKKPCWWIMSHDSWFMNHDSLKKSLFTDATGGCANYFMSISFFFLFYPLTKSILTIALWRAISFSQHAVALNCKLWAHVQGMCHYFEINISFFWCNSVFQCHDLILIFLYISYREILFEIIIIIFTDYFDLLFQDILSLNQDIMPLL